MINWGHISKAISDVSRTPFAFSHATPVSGGYTSRTWRLDGSENHYFVKLNAAEHSALFYSEQQSLVALADTRTVRVPRVITYGIADQHAFLVLEFLHLNTSGNSELFGKQLAALHRVHADLFGWEQDNALGLTPQPNTRSNDWLCFWRDQRIGFQLELALHKGYSGRLQTLGHRVMDALPDLLAEHHPEPSLLHGDLWGGNYAFLADGTPLMFDPATYYGDREADIAMTELFGGFDARFYAAYQAAYPLDAGYATRKNLYNLYHILNHCNMVSSSYVAQAEGVMQKLLS